MGLLSQAKFLLDISRTNDIARRYFVVNGFDGALTMLGLIIGFLVSAPDNLTVIINVCLGAAIALFMSGLSSAYISESAERRHAQGKLERAMISDLEDSTHGYATRWVPVLIALVNGLAPLIISSGYSLQESRCPYRRYTLPLLSRYCWCFCWAFSWVALPAFHGCVVVAKHYWLRCLLRRLFICLQGINI
jgi:F0F1-type ATP synthase membrane subunit c/vacuolar-type H+-ATPase subunit K